MSRTYRRKDESNDAKVCSALRKKHRIVGKLKNAVEALGRFVIDRGLCTRASYEAPGALARRVCSLMEQLGSVGSERHVPALYEYTACLLPSVYDINGRDLSTREMRAFQRIASGAPFHENKKVVDQQATGQDVTHHCVLVWDSYRRAYEYDPASGKLRDSREVIRRLLPNEGRYPGTFYAGDEVSEALLALYVLRKYRYEEPGVRDILRAMSKIAEASGISARWHDVSTIRNAFPQHVRGKRANTGGRRAHTRHARINLRVANRWAERRHESLPMFREQYQNATWNRDRKTGSFYQNLGACYPIWTKIQCGDSLPKKTLGTNFRSIRSLTGLGGYADNKTNREAGRLLKGAVTVVDAPVVPNDADAVAKPASIVLRISPHRNYDEHRRIKPLQKYNGEVCAAGRAHWVAACERLRRTIPGFEDPDARFPHGFSRYRLKAKHLVRAGAKKYGKVRWRTGEATVPLAHAIAEYVRYLGGEPGPVYWQDDSDMLRGITLSLKARSVCEVSKSRQVGVLEEECSVQDSQGPMRGSALDLLVLLAPEILYEESSILGRLGSPKEQNLWWIFLEAELRGLAQAVWEDDPSYARTKVCGKIPGVSDDPRLRVALGQWYSGSINSALAEEQGALVVRVLDYIFRGGRAYEFQAEDRWGYGSKAWSAVWRFTHLLDPGVAATITWEDVTWLVSTLMESSGIKNPAFGILPFLLGLHNVPPTHPPSFPEVPRGVRRHPYSWTVVQTQYKICGVGTLSASRARLAYPEGISTPKGVDRQGCLVVPGQRLRRYVAGGHHPPKLMWDQSGLGIAQRMQNAKNLQKPRRPKKDKVLRVQYRADGSTVEGFTEIMETA